MEQTITDASTGFILSCKVPRLRKYQRLCEPRDVYPSPPSFAARVSQKLKAPEERKSEKTGKITFHTEEKREPPSLGREGPGAIYESKGKLRQLSRGRDSNIVTIADAFSSDYQTSFVKYKEKKKRYVSGTF